MAYSEEQRQCEMSELNARYADEIAQTKDLYEANNHQTNLCFPKDKAI